MFYKIKIFLDNKTRETQGKAQSSSAYVLETSSHAGSNPATHTIYKAIKR
jgi:hypothetical protein